MSDNQEFSFDDVFEHGDANDEQETADSGYEGSESGNDDNSNGYDYDSSSSGDSAVDVGSSGEGLEPIDIPTK